MVDIIILVVSISFALSGFRRGFWHCFKDIVNTALSLIAGWISYQQNHKIVFSLLVSIIAFILFNAIFFLLGIILRKKDKTASLHTTLLSRIGGLVFGVCWALLFLYLIFLCVDLFLSDIPFVRGIIYNSKAYYVYQNLRIAQNISGIENIAYLSKVASNEKAKERLKAQPQYQEIINHKNFMAILDEPEIIKNLKEKNIPALLANKKFRVLLNDGEFLEKVMKLDFKKAALTESEKEN